MQYTRAFKLVEILYAATNGVERDRCRALFRRMVESLPEYQKLEHLWRNTGFFGGKGVHLMKNAQMVLEATAMEIDNANANIVRLSDVMGTIEDEIMQSNNAILNPYPHEFEAHAVESDKVQVYFEFYKLLAKMMLYCLVALKDTRKLHGIPSINAASFDSLLKIINGAFADEMKHITESAPLAWGIREQDFIGDNGVSYVGYVLEKPDEFNPQDYTLWGKEPAGYRVISPFILVATDPRAKYKVFGTGNFVGVDVENTERLSPAGLRKSLAAAQFDPDAYLLLDPIKEMRRALGTSLFVISPSEFVRCINAKQLADTVLQRKKTGRCLFCGAVLKIDERPGKLLCDNHLTLGRNIRLE
jgi:hypothetical protein